jgi:hypothetical protein
MLNASSTDCITPAYIGQGRIRRDSRGAEATLKLFFGQILSLRCDCRLDRNREPHEPQRHAALRISSILCSTLRAA